MILRCWVCFSSRDGAYSRNPSRLSRLTTTQAWQAPLGDCRDRESKGLCHRGTSSRLQLIRRLIASLQASTSREDGEIDAGFHLLFQQIGFSSSSDNIDAKRPGN